MKIRRFIPSDIKKLAQKIEFIEPINVYNFISDRPFTFFPLSLLNDSIPLTMRFLEQNYVALNKNELLGLIGLIPDNKQNTRWRINRLILDKNNLDIGKQLVNYVVNKYGGAGVESFITAIESSHNETILLFRNGCGFRNLSEIDVWKYKSEIKLEKVTLGEYKIREINSRDAKELLDLDTSLLYPQFRVSLKKSKNDFKINLKNTILDFLCNHNQKKLILFNKKNSIDGFITIDSKDKTNFYVNILLSLKSQDLYETVILYITNLIISQYPLASTYIYERKYYQTSAKLRLALSSLKFENDKNFKILVKDYWKPLPLHDEYKKSTFVILPDIASPACSNSII